MDWGSHGRAAPVDPDGFDADREALNFLDDHRLARSTTSYRLALQAILHPDSPLGREVARRTDGGIRLTEEDVKALCPLVREQEGEGRGALERDLDVQAEKLESLTSDARQITSDFSSDMAALSQAHHGQAEAAPDSRAIAALLEQLIARIAKTESDLAELSGNIAALRSRIDQRPGDAGGDAGIDSLTGVMSPLGAEGLIAELPTAPHGYVVATCGLDDLDGIEDRYGRSVADNVLRAFVSTLRQSCDEGDIVRWQPNIFLVILRGRPLSQAAAMMEQARAAMLARTLRLRGSGEPIGAVTLSAGLAAGVGEPMDAVYQRAEALRAIASAGLGNRVVSRA
ncbi:diguanylate cyclase [Sphingomonadaceae bacterium jetA1]|uniref:GGDEF domain-containing protein n=1 Tax=Facivitalis istanbulensis TaxID=3075838 RepID=UPI00348C3512